MDSPASARAAVFFVPAQQGDFESLLALRIEAMRESLERVGRFDVARARERFVSSFVAAHTRHIEADGRRVGFFATREADGHLWLDHLYIHPSMQRKGLGAIALEAVIAEAAHKSLPVRVGALKQSDSNRFYLRHRFKLVAEGEFDNHYLRQAEPAPLNATSSRPEGGGLI